MNEFGIALCFDSVTEAKLVSLQEQLKIQNIKSREAIFYSRPHVTLAVVRGGELSELVKSIETLVNKFECISVEINGVGLYPQGNDDVFLTLVANQILRQFHNECLRSLTASFVLFESYHQPERWVPHCTIGYSLSEVYLLKATELCRKSDVFGVTSLVKLVIIDVSTETEIGSFALKGK
jgi:2'-5' RNA ligase